MGGHFVIIEMSWMYHIKSFFKPEQYISKHLKQQESKPNYQNQIQAIKQLIKQN